MDEALSRAHSSQSIVKTDLSFPFIGDAFLLPSVFKRLASSSEPHPYRFRSRGEEHKYLSEDLVKIPL